MNEIAKRIIANLGLGIDYEQHLQASANLLLFEAPEKVRGTKVEKGEPPSVSPTLPIIGKAA